MLAEYLVIDDIVVRRSSSTLDRGVGFGDATANDGAVLRVPRTVYFFLLGCVEACVVPLADDNNGHAWFASFRQGA